MIGFKEYLIEMAYATKAHWQAAVNHILLHEPEEQPALVAAHQELLDKLSKRGPDKTKWIWGTNADNDIRGYPHTKVVTAPAPSSFDATAFRRAAEKGEIFNEKPHLPKLHQRHFEIVASWVRDHPNDKVRRDVAEHYISMFTRANPNFNEGRFRKWANLD